MKFLLSISIFLLPYGFFAQINPIVHWIDLSISRQISIVAGLILMFIVAMVGAIVMTWAWIRRGYEGIDQILEGKEVALLMSHIFAFISLEIFIFMITFRQELDAPQYAFWICSGTFIAPEVYMAINSLMKRPNKSKEE